MVHVRTLERPLISVEASGVDGGEHGRALSAMLVQRTNQQRGKGAS